MPPSQTQSVRAKKTGYGLALEGEWLYGKGSDTMEVLILRLNPQWLEMTLGPYNRISNCSGHIVTMA